MKPTLHSFISDQELLGVISPLLTCRLAEANRIDDERIELIMKEKFTHHIQADPKMKLPVDIDLVVPDKVTLAFDKENHKVTLVDNPIAILPTFRFFGQWHAGDILSIAPSEHIDDQGQRWFQITGEVHVSSVVKRALQALGVAQNTLWVTPAIVDSLCSQKREFDGS